MKAQISVHDPDQHLKRVLAAEEQRLLNDRASYSTTTEDDWTVIDFKAQDATALRAVINSVCKILIVYEKTKQVVDDER